jgi:hypothetical protein
MRDASRSLTLAAWPVFRMGWQNFSIGKRIRICIYQEIRNIETSGQCPPFFAHFYSLSPTTDFPM